MLSLFQMCDVVYLGITETDIFNMVVTSHVKHFNANRMLHVSTAAACLGMWSE